MKTITINNRRYFGNKYKLLPFITGVVAKECSDIATVADLFAGTGAVASAFMGSSAVVTNDLLYSNYICNLAWFSSESYRKEVIERYIKFYNGLENVANDYMVNTFADTYFSSKDCGKIGFIREDIENHHKAGELNERERAILIASLLYAADRIANTCGHYDGYRKGADFKNHLTLSLPDVSNENNPANKCFNVDANKLVRELAVDLVYLDPPYNSRQYSNRYHVLENIARWDKPAVAGVSRKMDCNSLKSDYCTKKAPQALEDLVANVNAKYVLLSYNNMAQKGHIRSNAKIADEDIMRILSSRGNVEVFETDYKAYNSGTSDIKDNKERLFLCHVTN